MPRTLFILLVFLLPLCAQDPTDAQHLWLDIELLPSTHTITGTCTWNMVSNVNNLASVTLQLHHNFSVSNVTAGGAPASFTRPGDGVVIALNQLYNQGQAFTVSLHYTGTPANVGFSSFTFGTHGNPSTAIAASLSEPWYAYTWWPCKETLTDKFTTATWVTVPANLYAACNGVLQGTDALSGNRTRYRWASNYPIVTYGVSVTATNYQIRTDTYSYLGANMPVKFYAYPESFAGQQANMNRIVPMLTVYSSLFGQYPFVNEKYGICQFNWGGGMEHQTITSQVNFSEHLSAHELGHSWWGNCITCATWHDIGLNEGFATYMEALWDEHKAGGGSSAYFARMNSNRPPNPGATGSVYVNNITSVGNIFSTNNVYRKGAWVLHMLRHVVGDTAFFQLMNDYKAAKAYQSATWQDFAAVASTSWGQDLTWFVNQCVMRPGSPSYDLSWTNQTVDGQNFVFGSIRQTQGGTPYRFPIDVRLTTSAQQSTHVIWNDQGRDDFVLTTSAPVSSVVLDPAPWILRGPTTSSPYSPSLQTSAQHIPWTGGVATLTLDAGPSQAYSPYLIAASATGISPGIPLPDGKLLPLVLDPFTTVVYLNTNGPMFQNWSGVLDANGQATAQLVIPSLSPQAAPITAHFAFVALAPQIFTSNPVTIAIP